MLSECCRNLSDIVHVCAIVRNGPEEWDVSHYPYSFCPKCSKYVQIPRRIPEWRKYLNRHLNNKFQFSISYFSERYSCFPFFSTWFCNLGFSRNSLATARFSSLFRVSHYPFWSFITADSKDSFLPCPDVRYSYPSVKNRDDSTARNCNQSVSVHFLEKKLICGLLFAETKLQHQFRSTL